MPIGLKNYSDGSETFVSGYEYVLDVDDLPPPLALKSFGIPSGTRAAPNCSWCGALPHHHSAKEHGRLHDRLHQSHHR